MKVKLSKAFALNEFCKKIAEEKLPLKLSYKIAKAALIIETELDFYRKQYSNYLNLFILKDEDGEFVRLDDGSLKIIPGAESECEKKFTELNEFEFDLPNFTFTLDELEGLNVSVADMTVLAPFIIE